jgi:alpha-beta hydrolase superfamily lysophospholipase
MLDGFFIDRKSKSGAIFVHGLCSRINPNELKVSLADCFTANNFSFLMFNNRGFGNVNSFFIKDGKVKTAGGSMEHFEDCIYDINASIRFMKSRGCKKIILVGHSTGCQKIAYFLSKTKNHSRFIKGTVFLAPANDTEGLITTSGKKKFNHLLKKSKSLQKTDSFITYLSARRFYDLHKPNSIEGNIFNYDLPRLHTISKIRVPILAVFGTKDKYITKCSAKDKLIKISESAISPTAISEIPFADHGFKNNTNELCKIISGWLKK